MGGGGGGGGVLNNVYTGMIRPKVQTLTLSCTMFDRNGTPFTYLHKKFQGVPPPWIYLLLFVFVDN